MCILFYAVILTTIKQYSIKKIKCFNLRFCNYIQIECEVGSCNSLCFLIKKTTNIYGKDINYCIITLRGEIWAYKTSLTTPLDFTNPREWAVIYICAMGIWFCCEFCCIFCIPFYSWVSNKNWPNYNPYVLSKTLIHAWTIYENCL